MKKYILEGMHFNDEKAGNNISWRSIFAGVVTFVAVSILFSLISAAIGIGVPDFTSQNPLEGVGMGLVIWVIIALVISLGLAGYVVGITANRAGFIHGFLTWALSVIVMFALMTSAVGAVFNSVGILLGYTGQVAGDVVSGTADTVGSLSQDAFDAIAQEIDVDSQDLEQTVTGVLEDTEIEQLQPDYLDNQVQATMDDVSQAGYNIVVQGADPQAEVEQVIANIQERVDAIGQELDEDALAEAIANNTDLTDQEAEEAVANIQESYSEASAQAQQALNDAQQAVSDLQVQAEQALAESAQVAEDVSNATSRYSLYVFVGLLLALVITSFAGYAGAKTARETHNAAV